MDFFEIVRARSAFELKREKSSRVRNAALLSKQLENRSFGKRFKIMLSSVFRRFGLVLEIKTLTKNLADKNINKIKS
jgi:hypothetical protein